MNPDESKICLTNAYIHNAIVPKDTSNVFLGAFKSNVKWFRHFMMTDPYTFVGFCFLRFRIVNTFCLFHLFEDCSHLVYIDVIISTTLRPSNIVYLQTLIIRADVGYVFNYCVIICFCDIFSCSFVLNQTMKNNRIIST